MELLSRGPQAAASYLKQECYSERGCEQLNCLLDWFLKEYQEFDADSFNWCLWLLAGGKTPDEFFQALRNYDNSPFCGLVWNANFVAYRCRDCGISPCMSLCADCFQAGNHDGHDFNMFKSQAGGACDCGDETVMKSLGFCSNHGPDRKKKVSCVPDGLVALPKMILPRLLLSLHEKFVLKLKAKDGNDEGTAESAAASVQELLRLFQKVCDVEVLREIVCCNLMKVIPGSEVVTSRNAGVSSNLTSITCSSATGRQTVRNTVSDMTTSIEITVTAMPDREILSPSKVMLEGSGAVCGFSDAKEPRVQTFLQFLVDVLVKEEFPNHLATFLLQLLPNREYKETFTRLFCNQYTAIGKSLSLSRSPDTLSNHIVHVSVQLFSNEALAFKMVKEEYLLFKMIFVLIKMVGECLDSFTLNLEGSETSIMSVDCNNRILESHCYWPVASDLINILSHKSVIKVFLEAGDCLSRWMYFVNMLTGININNRRLLSHIEYEPKTYYTAFSVEFESVAAVMWEVYRGIGRLGDKSHVLKMVEVSSAALKDWFSFVPYKIRKGSFTFHLALHRYLALFLSQAIVSFDQPVEQVLPSTQFLVNAMIFPLKALVALQEIRANLWVLSGHQIRYQAQSYVQSNFCNSMLDLDVFFLQLVASLIDADEFMEILVDQFCIRSWFQFGLPRVNTSSPDTDSEKVLTVVEGFLSTILTLLTHRVYAGANDELSLRKDIIAGLCIGDGTHSQLTNVVPTRQGESHSHGRNFEQILAEIADYKSPAFEVSGMQQGKYSLREAIWEQEYDYNHVQLRAYNRSDHQAAQERYNAVVHKTGSSATAVTWPPLRDLEPIHPAFKGVLRLLHSKTLHRLLIFIVNKAVTEPSSVSEPILIASVHLLQLALDYKDAEVPPASFVKLEDKDSGVMDLMSQYFDVLEVDSSLDCGQARVVESLRAALFEGSTSKLEGHARDEDVVFQFITKHYQVFFAEMTKYIETVVSQALSGVPNIRLSRQLYHLKNLALLLSDKKYVLLKRMVQYIRRFCEREGVRISDLPFVKERNDSKSFALLLGYLTKHQDIVFQAHDGPHHLPPDAFGLSLPYASIADNASVSLARRDVFARCEVAGSEKLSEALVGEDPALKAFTDHFCEETGESSDLNLALHAFHSGFSPSPGSLSKSESDGRGGSESSDGEMSDDQPSCNSHSQVQDSNSADSLLTLLIKLRHLLHGKSKALSVKSKRKVAKITAGDGVFYLDRLLQGIYFSSEENAKIISSKCPSVMPDSHEMRRKEKEMMDHVTAKEERKKLVVARQQKLLEEFASKQRRFIEQMGESSSGSMDISDSGVAGAFSEEILKQECVICGQVTESSEDRPLGLVVLMQPSTILCHRQFRKNDARADADGASCLCVEGCEELINQRKSGLRQFFEIRSVRSAFECGLDCGINFQTCGHYLHVNCQQAYFKSLQQEEQRSSVFNVEKGEFSCPLCRQLSNGVLPLLPHAIRSCVSNKSEKVKNCKSLKEEAVRLYDYFLEQRGGELTYFTARALEFSVLTASLSSLAYSVEELVKTSSQSVHNFYDGGTWKWSDQFFVLLAAVRHNLEMELIRETTKPLATVSSVTSKSSFSVLVEACQFFCQYVSSPMSERWAELTLAEDREAQAFGGSSFTYSEVPLVLCDTVSLLIQFMITWPQRMSHADLLAVIQGIYNLSVVQALVEIGSTLQSSEKQSWAEAARQNPSEVGLEPLASAVWTKSACAHESADKMEGIEISQELISSVAVDMRVQDYCLPFLQAAAVLVSTWFQIPLPEPLKDEWSFAALATYLKLGRQQHHRSDDVLSVTDFLDWPCSSPLVLAGKWCMKLAEVYQKTQIAKQYDGSVKTLLPVSRLWCLPRLIDLPHSFDSLFQQYRKHACSNCNQPADDPTLCLVCGQFLCFHGRCCAEGNVFECVQHSISCGCGTGLFLVISSSVTIIIRGERVCIWGSVYLDNYGEEDRDLKRGRPLFLSAERYNWLQEEWRAHSFDRTSKRWALHLNKL